MEIPVQLPLDDDGFLRRECPSCEGQFKWFPSEDSAPEPEGGYHCPLCGEQSSLDQWWTPSQVSFAQSAAAQAFTEQLGSELGALVRSRAEGLFRVDVESVSVPARLVEPNDLGIALSPCHPEEPVKVPAVLGEAMYCLMCGSAFAT